MKQEFAPILKRIHDKLDLPQAAKSRIVLEISADMEDLYQECKERGMTDDEAVRKVCETMEASNETLRELTEIHTSLFNRIANRISDRPLSLWENLVLVTVLLLITGVSAHTILTTPFFSRANVAVYPVLAVFIGTMVRAAFMVPRLFFTTGRDPRNMRRGLSTIFAGGSLCAVISLLGYVIDLYFSRMDAMFLGPDFFLYFIDSGSSLSGAVEWLIRNTSMMMFGMFTVMTISLIWFMMLNKAVRNEQAETVMLIDIN